MCGVDRPGCRPDVGVGGRERTRRCDLPGPGPCAAVEEMIDQYIAKLNGELDRWETIKKWVLLDHDLSIERGELTPSLKVKRSVVAEQNKQVLDALYT